jgi:hypothetical protein
MLLDFIFIIINQAHFCIYWILKVSGSQEKDISIWQYFSAPFVLVFMILYFSLNRMNSKTFSFLFVTNVFQFTTKIGILIFKSK